MTGHGGSDSGAVANNRKEKDYNLKASNYMYNRFKDLGIPAAITRDTDKTLSREDRVSKMINSFGNGSDVIVLSNHINAGGGEGAEVVYPLRSDGILANDILNGIGSAGQKMRKVYQRRLDEDSNKDYYYVQRLTPDTESLIIEYGFIDNPNDVKKLDDNLLNYVEQVVKAVASYAGVNYTPPTTDSDTYVVKSGDTMYSIAKKYNTTVQELEKLNNLNNNFLKVGQTLIIPRKNTYTIVKGDTLYSIASKYGITVSELKDYNNLTSDILAIGQVLLIPNSSVGNAINKTYTVVKGDTLYSIAKNNNISVTELKELNNLNTSLLYIGQILKLK